MPETASFAQHIARRRLSALRILPHHIAKSFSLAEVLEHRIKITALAHQHSGFTLEVADADKITTDIGPRWLVHLSACGGEVDDLLTQRGEPLRIDGVFENAIVQGLGAFHGERPRQFHVGLIDGQ